MHYSQEKYWIEAEQPYFQRRQNTADKYVAVIRFGKYASDEDLKFYSDKLKNLLKDNGITTSGNYRFLRYNPPYQFVGRRNEIIVTVDWKEKGEKDKKPT